MKTAIYLALLFVFFIHQDIKAQQENISSINAGNTQDLNAESNSSPGLGLENKTLMSSQNRTNQVFSNNTKVNQIGMYNNSQVNLKSSRSNLTVSQFGNKNDVNIYKSAPEIEQTIQQVGNSNYISDFSLYSNYKVDMQINQRGNNLTIFNNGTNSISKEMKITQTGNSGTVYIFNR